MFRRTVLLLGMLLLGIWSHGQQIAHQFGTFNVCSGSYTDSGRDTANYSNSEGSMIVFCDTMGGCIQLAFDYFQVEADSDRIAVFDGPNIFYPLIGTFSGNNPPDTLRSSDSCMAIIFFSDQDSTEAGWEADISCFPCPVIDTCLTRLGNCLDSTCSSPFYDTGGPGTTYLANEDIMHTVCPGIPGQCIQVVFNSFFTEWAGDELSIYDGTDTVNSVLIGKWSGPFSPGTVQSRTGCLTFAWQSDSIVHAAGWDAMITCTPCPITCESIISNCTDTTCNSKLFDSGGPANNYGPNEWLVRTYCSDACNCAYAVFEGFRLHSSDTLFIYDGPDTNSTLFAAYTGNPNLAPILASGECFTFKFKSDGSTEYRGFEITLQCEGCQTGTCGPNMTDGCYDSICSGNFLDPGGYNQQYPTDETLIHTMCSDSGDCIWLNFKEYETDPFDTLFVWDAPDTSGGPRDTFVGANIPTLVNSYNNGCLTFMWVSTEGGTWNGWNAQIYCGQCVRPCERTRAGFSYTDTLVGAWFTDTSSTIGDSVRYTWDFGDGNTDSVPSPLHYYSDTGRFTVTLIVEDSCGIDTSVVEIHLECPFPCPMPIRAELQALAIGDAVVLTWNGGDQTIGSQYFVERSYNALTFQEIGRKNGLQGNAEHDFMYLDHGPDRGKDIYYRVRESTANGATNYTNIAVARLDGPASDWLLVYPNPVDQGQTLILDAAIDSQENVEFQLFDATGRLMVQTTAYSEGGLARLRLSSQGLPKGTFFLHARSPKGLRVQKVMIR